MDFLSFFKLFFFVHFALELEETLNTHEKKVDSIKNTIWQTGLKNNNISSTLNILAKNDGSMKMVADIGKTADKISDQMRELRRGAVDISSDVYKLKSKLNALEPEWDTKLGFAEENGIHLKFQRLKFF